MSLSTHSGLTETTFIKIDRLLFYVDEICMSVTVTTRSPRFFFLITDNPWIELHMEQSISYNNPII